MQLQVRLNGTPCCPAEVDVAVQLVLGAQHLDVVAQRHLADAIVVKVKLVLCEVSKVLADLQEALEGLQQQCSIQKVADSIAAMIVTQCTRQHAG